VIALTSGWPSLNDCGRASPNASAAAACRWTDAGWRIQMTAPLVAAMVRVTGSANCGALPGSGLGDYSHPGDWRDWIHPWPFHALPEALRPNRGRRILTRRTTSKSAQLPRNVTTTTIANLVQTPIAHGMTK
jgi:hypothetical protein